MSIDAQRLDLLTVVFGQTKPPSDFHVLHFGVTGRLVKAQYRPWYEGRWRVEELLMGDLGRQDTLRHLTRHVLPVVMVAEEGASPPEWAGELLARRDVHLVNERNGALEHEGYSILVSDISPHYAETCLGSQLRIEADVGLSRLDVALPLSLPIRTGAARSPRRRVRVAGRHPVCPLPESSWFSVPPGVTGATLLEIDVIPARDAMRQDAWQLTIVGDDGRRSLQPAAPPPAEVEGEPPRDRIALVFDRTAPSQAGWETARQISMGQVRQASRFTQADSRTAGSPNADLVAGLVPALVKAFPGETRLALVAVADSGGSALSAPTGYTLEPDVAVLATGVKVEELMQHQGSLSWAPGIDVWDPMGTGLSRALSWAREWPDRAAVVIVGNSPPFPSGWKHDALRELLLGRRGFEPTALRAPDPSWQLELEIARDLGIPVVYVFLQYASQPGFSPQWFQRFQAMQGVIQDALRGTVEWVEAPATAEGLALGMCLAMERIARPSPGQAHAIELRVGRHR